MNYTSVNSYRKDIDGLRAIAVLAVIFFHFGFLPNGYLGVDVFFVISGYLITGIIYNELSDNRFSMINFYLRRIRRIIPLALFISLVSLVIGIVTMLPDDLENLAQSVVATNLLSNNILQAITTKNYWEVVNEYKPLMHTWSLGVEEQFYLFYPLLFLLVGKKNRTWILPMLIILTVASFALSVSPTYSNYQKFYLIPFRFYELSAGGIAAICLSNKLIVHRYSFLFVIGLLFILFTDLSFILSQQVLLPIVILLTLGIIASSNDKSKLSSFILKNKIMVFAGLISFSLYMWHQVLLAYARYFIVQELGIPHLVVIFILTVILSVLSWKYIEQPFRNNNRISTQALLLSLGLSFVVINSTAFYIHLRGGILKDIPELGITKDQAGRNINAKYNKRVFKNDKSFVASDKIRVLVIGNSFARDWVNVLLESKYKNDLEISYIIRPFDHKELEQRAQNADVIFYSTARKADVIKLGLDISKLYVIGTKNYGTSSGIFYNYRGDDYFKQRTLMDKGYWKKNEELSAEWKERYINYIDKIIDKNKTVPVFTPDNKFISQDCRHFTKAGAKYFAELFEKKLGEIFESAKNKRERQNRHAASASNIHNYRISK